MKAILEKMLDAGNKSLIEDKPRTLKEVRRYLYSIPYINQGGCAIAAIAMKRWIERNLKKKASIVYLYHYDDEHSFNWNEKYKNNDKRFVDSCAHAGILYGRKIIDCRDEEIDYCYDMWHELPESVVLDSLNISVNWNPNFNRRWKMDIQKKLDIRLSDIKINGFNGKH